MENQQSIVEGRILGRMPAKASPRALMASDFIKYLKLPKKTNYWRTKKAIPVVDYGNTEMGNCTRAKQAVAHVRMERLEQRKTISISKEEVVRVYREMSDRLYGGGDNGAFEDDALSEWRKPDTTFRDKDGNPLTIDAFLRLNPFNHDEVRAAIAMSGAKGIAVCFALPIAFQAQVPPADWSIPTGQSPTGKWMANSWGGHSMWAHDYDEIGIWLDHTWLIKPQRVTWEACSLYMDEAHMVIDSVDTWRKKMSSQRAARINMKDVIAAVNDVSSYKIAA